MVLVGPATLVLHDGSTIEVASHTPGGNMCRLLGGGPFVGEKTCFVTGSFRPGTNELAWFAAMPSSDDYLDVVGFRDRVAQLYLDEHSRFELPIRADARLDGCPAGDLSVTPIVAPNAPALYATVNADDEVVLIACGADY